MRAIGTSFMVNNCGGNMFIGSTKVKWTFARLEVDWHARKNPDRGQG